MKWMHYFWLWLCCFDAPTVWNVLPDEIRVAFIASKGLNPSSTPRYTNLCLNIALVVFKGEIKCYKSSIRINLT